MEKDDILDVVNWLFISTDNKDCNAAFHYLPNPTGRNTRTFVGSYDLHLAHGEDGWRIDRFKFSLKFIEGNLNLEHS